MFEAIVLLVCGTIIMFIFLHPDDYDEHNDDEMTEYFRSEMNGVTNIYYERRDGDDD